MENNFGFDYHQHPHMLPNMLSLPLDDRLSNTYPIRRNPNAVEDFTSRSLPAFPLSGLQHLKASEPNNFHNWFCVKSGFNHAFAPILNSPSSLLDFRQQIGHTIGTQPAQKRYFVFDQSGDKTTLLYSSWAHSPVQFGAYWVPNPLTTDNLKAQSDTNNGSRLSSNDGNIGDYSGGDMREDTEEINALLCSDDDTDFSEDDETSTGHSPSTMTDNIVPKQAEEMGEEVDSFSVPPKKRKLPQVGYDAASLNTVDCSALESDAESSCGNCKEGPNSFSGCKRSRREKIYGTVGILQNIIPHAEGKDAIVVIDEAIRCLKSLKDEARALGLGAD